MFFFEGVAYGVYGGSVQNPFENTLTTKIRVSASF